MYTVSNRSSWYGGARIWSLSVLPMFAASALSVGKFNHGTWWFEFKEPTTLAKFNTDRTS